MFIPIDSERVRGIDFSNDWAEVKWIDGTVGVLDLEDAMNVSRALREGFQRLLDKPSKVRQPWDWRPAT